MMNQTKRISLNRKQKLALLSAPTLILFLLFEGGLRLAVPRLVWPSAEWIWEGDVDEDSQEWPASYPKGSKGVLAHLEFEVDLEFNSDGFRGPEFNSEADKVVIFLGDSQTMGHGVELKDSFVQLSRESLGNGEVWNLGRSGSGGVEQARLLKRFLEKYPKANIEAVVLIADLSIQAAAGNDIVDTYGLVDYLEEGEPEDGEGMDVMPWRYMLRRSAIIRSGEVMLGKWRRENLVLPRPREFESMWEQYNLCLEQIHKLTNQRGAELMIVFLLPYASEPRDAIDETKARLLRFAEPRNVPVILGAPGIAEELDGKFWYFPIDGHINELGHQYIFQQFFPTLEQIINGTVVAEQQTVSLP